MTESQENPTKPIPLSDELTRPFWDAAGQHRLEIQRCSPCGYYNHPPKPLCDRCGSEELAFEAVSGKGAIYSYTVMRQRNVRGFQDEVPYLNVIVELDEQPMLFMITNLMGAGLDDAKIGQRVEVTYEERDEVTLPQFRLAGE